MITITNGSEEFIIKKEDLWNRKKHFKGLVTKPRHNYWSIELLFIKKGISINNKFKKIVKCYPDGDAFLQEFINLDSNKSNYILLSNTDYEEVKVLIDNMKIEKDYKKEAIIEASALLFGFECYQNYIMERDFSIESKYIFKSLAEIGYVYENYKDEIYLRTKEILKEKYKVDIEI